MGFIDVNLNGQAYGALAAIPYLRREGRGAIVFVSSLLGRVAAPLQSACTAAKHGILGMAEALRMELDEERSGIQVTTILPAAIDAPFFETARAEARARGDRRGGEERWACFAERCSGWERASPPASS